MCQNFNMIVFIYMEHYIISIKENIMYQDSNEMFNYNYLGEMTIDPLKYI
jgi:hypothetical protein